MPRSLTVNATNEIAKKFGTEPVTIVGIYWDGITQMLYADKDVLGIPGKILDVGSLDEIIKVDSKSSNASIEVTLDDTDGTLKTIFNTIDIHKKKCVIYQHFDGLTINDAFIILVGEVNTPVIWNESERSLKFTIISKIESIEVGFAPEEGQFANVNSAFIGKVWPLAFGEVVHVPATKVTEKLRGVTQTLVGIPDFTLPYKYWHLIERRETILAGFTYYAGGIKFLEKIARKPDPIIDDYINTILLEDIDKQQSEDLTISISENEKFLDNLKKVLDGAEIVPQTYKYLRLKPDPGNQGKRKPPKRRLQYVEFDVTTREQVKSIVTEVTDLVKAFKDEVESLTVTLEDLSKVKHLLEIETDNAEYAYKNIHNIDKKIQKLLIEYVKNEHEIFKLVQIMEEQALIPQTFVSILNGYKFPQNQVVRISIKGLTYSGVFTGDLFSIIDYEPRYAGVQIAERQDEQLDAFWITDPTINLKGHYCLTVGIIGPGDPEYVLQQSGYDISSIQNRIFKVVDQIGTKCVLELVELETSQRVEKATGKLPVLSDLTQDVYDALQFAQEHTEEERKRILENALSKYDKEELSRMKKLLDQLKDLAQEATTKDELAVLNQTIFRNLHEYNNKVAHLKYTKDTIEKAFEIINHQEFKTLLQLCNLRLQRVDQEFYDSAEIPVTKVYYLTGFDIRNIIASSPVMLPSWFQFTPGGGELVTNKTIVPLPGGTRVIADFLPDSTLWFSEPGSEVELVSDQSEKYIANTLPSTIYAVYGYKGIKGFKTLVPIPSSYYIKNENDTSYLPFHCTTITLKKPLKDYADEDWEDGVYVTMASSVGPNTVDIIEGILETATNVVSDPTSFNYVRGRLANYPSSFCLFDKKDALKLIEDIVWQARCVAYVRNGIMYLKYLSEEPTSVATLTESDMEFGSLSVEYTPTEEVITKLVAKWQPTYAARDKFNQLIVRSNLVKYGEISSEGDKDFFIYNIEELVYKSLTFWLIRMSNTWKIAKFKTPLNRLDIETLDCITLNPSNNYFATGSVKAIVDKATYDSANNSIEFQCWLPVRAGEMTPYNFAFPADIAVDVLYPSVDEINSGFAGSPHNVVPKNLAYKIRPNVSIVDQLELRPKDYGDAFPSDGANFFPPSPLQGLNESDYIAATPKQFKMPNVNRLGDKEDKPNFGAPVGNAPPQDAGKKVFHGRVAKITDSVQGVYLVETLDGKSYEVNQIGVGGVFDVGAPITVVYDLSSNQYYTNDAVVDKLQLALFVVREELNDWMYCVRIEYRKQIATLHDAALGQQDAAEFFNLVKVAKPRLLQKTPFHAKTVAYPNMTVTYTYGSIGQRVASSPGLTDETQMITPPYFVGDIIVARKTNTGYEGVEYIDMNEGGRQWALIPS